MGVFDGFGPNLTRNGPEGDRFYTPFGRFGAVYRVADDETAGRITRDWRAFGGTLVAVALIGAPMIGLASWHLVLLAPVAAIAAIPFAAWAGRGLTRSTLGAAGLGVVSQSPAARIGRAVRPWIPIVTSAVMTVAGVVAAFITPDPTLWLATAFFAVCTAGLYLFHRRRR